MATMDINKIIMESLLNEDDNQPDNHQPDNTDFVETQQPTDGETQTPSTNQRSTSAAAGAIGAGVGATNLARRLRKRKQQTGGESAA